MKSNRMMRYISIMDTVLVKKTLKQMQKYINFFIPLFMDQIKIKNNFLH